MKEFFIRRKIKKYTRSLTKFGDEPQLLEKIADLYVKISENEQARQYYVRTITAYYQGETRLGNDNEFILTQCWKLLDLDPLNELAFHTLGQEFCGLGHFNEAAALYQRFAEKLVQCGHDEKAIAQYRNVAVLRPEDIEVRQRLVTLLWKFRRKEETAHELKKIARLAEKRGHAAKMLECCHKALKLLPADSSLQAELQSLIRSARQMEKPLELVVTH
ncbi:hypothetical protein CSB45_05895 [candidate division KSB3 bacterium]|uniref:Tetratricopeptide repeat protein n=1 Tax=candidate division KSB3 bacterium TaxID=2044937 RepID=A0A2G6E6P7_9BACT|nr:MAG: hypothetical protein CSB45_05895 [candidate division KSB3 bacterium]PIE30182.1 MAG: hypothetical protein CSA57_04615 [candidate division KSB3 bacterium]